MVCLQAFKRTAGSNPVTLEALTLQSRNWRDLLKALEEVGLIFKKEGW